VPLAAAPVVSPPVSPGQAAAQEAVLNVPRQAARDAAADRGEAAGSQPDDPAEVAPDADPGQAHPGRDDADTEAPGPAEAREPAVPPTRNDEPGDAGDEGDAGDGPGDDGGEIGASTAEEPPLPAFHRMWSSPTPPGDDYDN
jgi:hypothetical protein